MSAGPETQDHLHLVAPGLRGFVHMCTGEPRASLTVPSSPHAAEALQGWLLQSVKPDHTALMSAGLCCCSGLQIITGQLQGENTELQPGGHGANDLILPSQQPLPAPSSLQLPLFLEPGQHHPPRSEQGGWLPLCGKRMGSFSRSH